MAKKLTPYDILGVARNAPDEVIRGAYKALAQKNHPDKNLGNPDSTNIMQEINRAYDVLSDPAKKADYDMRLNQQEMAAAARTEERAQRTSQQPTSYSGRYAGGPMSPFPTQSRGKGVIFLIAVLIAAFCFVAFIYDSSSPIYVRPLFPGAANIAVPPLPVSRPKPAEAFVPRETTPQELAVCIFAAAKTYAVPPALLLSLLSVEGGEVGESVPASGHTNDLGLMQINSFWIPEFAKVWEVSEETALHRVRDDACVNIGMGAWILQTALSGKNADLRSQIALYRASAHHSALKTGDKEYVDKVIKLMELYKPIRGPEDLLGQSAVPTSK